MPLFSFSVGLTLRRGEQILEFVRHLEDGHVQFEDRLSRRIYSWPLPQIYREINNGNLAIFRGDEVQQSSSSAGNSNPKSISLMPSLESLPRKYRDDLERKLDYVRSCKKQGITRGQRKKVSIMIAKIATRRKESPPSTSSVMDWWRVLDDSDHYPGALVSGYIYRRQRRRLHTAVLDLIRKIAKKEYFTRARHPLDRTLLLVNQALKNPIIIEGEVVSPKQVSASSVRRVVNEVDLYFRDVARYGPAYAKNKWRYSLKGTTTTRVMERLEIDHTQLDIVVICDQSGMPLGRPTITVVIDAHSGYVLSFFVSFWGTGLGPTLNALKIAITPKDDYCNGPIRLNNPWLGYGLCELIVVDNGLEFHSPQFQLAAWHINADVQYCAVRQPWLKPSVERALKAQDLYLPSQGRVHKRLPNYLPPNPRDTASITFSQLCHGLLKCFVDVLPMQPNSRTLIEPFEVFRDGFERLPPPLLPSSFQELDLIGAMSKELTVNGEGIVFQYLRYNSAALQDIRRGTRKLKFKTTMKFHPENLDFCYVQDPLSKDWIMVPSCYPEYTNQLSIVQHHAIRAHLKARLKERNVLEKLTQGRLELIELYDGFLRGNRGKKNVQAAQKFGTLTSAQTLSAHEVAAKTIIPESSLVTAESCMPGSKEIPKFSSFHLD